MRPSLKTAQRIASAMADPSLNLNASDPEDWVKAIQYSGVLYPNVATVNAARKELKRLKLPPVEITTRRESHRLRRRAK